MKHAKKWWVTNLYHLLIPFLNSKLGKQNFGKKSFLTPLTLSYCDGNMERFAQRKPLGGFYPPPSRNRVTKAQT